MGFCCSAICGFQGKKTGREWWKICWLCGGVILCYYRYYVAVVVSQLVVLPCGNHNRFYHPTARKMVKNGTLHCCADFLQEERTFAHLQSSSTRRSFIQLHYNAVVNSSNVPPAWWWLEVCSNSSEHDASGGRGWKNAELCDKFSLHIVVVVLAKHSGNFLCNFSSNYNAGGKL